MGKNMNVQSNYNPLCCALFTILIQLYHGSNALDLDNCRNALGMENGKIPDSAITASSSFRDDSVGPANARIRHERGGGAWCPSSIITSTSYEYLQINFDQLMLITQVEVQGRFGNGQGKEYAEYFYLDYQREEGGSWTRFSNDLGEERFTGNENTYLAVERTVSPPIICRRIRFVPYSEKSRQICMRVEVYGCQWDGSCWNALGMENGNIPDSAITASSSFRDDLVGPANARIRHERGGGAWCPSSPVSRTSYEYLQINFDQLMLITRVEVQGRFGNGQGKEYAEFFFLDYQQEDDGNWTRFSNDLGKKRFTGNTNVYQAVTRTVSPPIICRRIRFVPYSEKPKTVCMRVEVYGCQWDSRWHL